MRPLAILFLLSCIGCGNSSRTLASGYSEYEGPTQAEQYDQCLEANSNVFGSPLWYAWVNDCKLRYGLEQ